MPGYEPFLLCDFHIHSTWSDGRLAIRGNRRPLQFHTGRFDVIAITDHILGRKGTSSVAGRTARDTGTPALFAFSRDEFDRLPGRNRRAVRGARSLDRYGMLVLPGAEVTQNHIRAKRNAHIIGPRHQAITSAPTRTPRDYPDRDPPPGRVEHRLPSPPSGNAAYRDQHVLPVGPPQGALGLVDVWEAANRDDLFSVTSLKHYPIREQRLPQAQAPLFVEDARLGPRRPGPPSRRRCRAHRGPGDHVVSRGALEAVLTRHRPARRARRGRRTRKKLQKRRRGDTE